VGNILPNQLYRVFKSRPLTAEGKDALIHLYQPIIESDALALYLTLVADSQDPTENEFIHLDILNAMNVGMQRFIQARNKLEGIGLLKTFEKDDSDLGRTFLYHLQEPVYAKNFFQDELYSFLLLSRVGERKFRQLVSLFEPAKWDEAGYQEVTVSFMDAYRLDPQQFAANDQKLKQVNERFKDEKNELTLDENLLDWDFILYEAQRRYIRADNFDKAFRQKLVLYHSLYGYDVMELLDLLADHVSLTTGKIDQKALDQSVLQKARTRFTKSTEKHDSSSEEEIRRFNTLKQNGYTENDLALIRESENNAPMAFLKAIKAEKKSFVTDSEQWLLKSLVERSPLSTSVINVLIHYVLVVQNNASLTANYVNNIAAQWSELQIKTAEDAIKHVRDIVKSAKEKRRPQAKGTSKKIIREEKLPSWAEKPVEEKALSPERQAEIDKKLQAYLQKKAGDN
jgi:replication initiation and membrane attachment protein